MYRADHDLSITDAQVAALSTLYFDMNPYISPEKEMGFVTGVYLNTFAPETRCRRGDGWDSPVRQQGAREKRGSRHLGACPDGTGPVQPGAADESG